MIIKITSGKQKPNTLKYTNNQKEGRKIKLRNEKQKEQTKQW